MAQDVLCEVNNCVYNIDGQKCNASKIYVVSHKGRDPESSSEVDCKTFEPEGI